MSRSNYKRRYIHNSKRNRPPGAGAGVKMLTVLTLFALVYFLSAGITGQWLYDNIAAPVISYFGFGDITDPIVTDPITSPVPTASPTGDTTKIEKTISISGFTDYMIQVGAYDNQNNAQTEAASFKSRGAAGYIVSADKYRVIAASYQSKTSAESVKTSLSQNDGIESLIYEYNVPKLEFKITATQSQITTIENIFNKYIELKNSIGALSLSLDNSQVDITGAKNKLSEYKSTVSDYADSLNLLAQGNSDNKIINGLNLLYTALLADINSMINTNYSTATAMSADLKYCNVKMTDKYSAFLSDITN